VTGSRTRAPLVVALLVLAPVVPAGGGGGTATPDRADFVEMLVEGSDRTISQSVANCIYDEVSGDEDLLRALADDGDLTTEQALRRDEAISTCLTGG
jgi:hypothetical protein